MVAACHAGRRRRAGDRRPDEGAGRRLRRSKRSNQAKKQRLKIDGRRARRARASSRAMKRSCSVREGGLRLQAAAGRRQGASRRRKNGSARARRSSGGRGGRRGVEDVGIGCGPRPSDHEPGVLAPIVVAGEAVSAVADAVGGEGGGGGALGKVSRRRESSVGPRRWLSDRSLRHKSDMMPRRRRSPRPRRTSNAAEGTQVRRRSPVRRGSPLAHRHQGVGGRAEEKMKLREAG